MRAVTGQLGQSLFRWTELPDVADALTAARGAIDELLWRRDIRADAASVTAASRFLGARDSAAIEGADIAVVEDSPMGRVLGAAAAVTGEAPAIADVWSTAPLQALARLHVVAARQHLPEDVLGRPRVGDEVPDDPLNSGPAPDAATASRRLALLAELSVDSADVPALAVAGIAHAEMLVTRPFAWGSGLVGRALVRVVLVARGVDPSMFSIPEVGMMTLGRPAYVRALRAYEDGKIDDYLLWFSQSIGLGAQRATTM